jgi:hypothetical protein
LRCLTPYSNPRHHRLLPPDHGLTWRLWEGGLRMRRLWSRLFRRRCPVCRTEVRRGSEGAVRCCGRWCCSQSHAEAYACNLYAALDEFRCRHAARHGVYVPRLGACTMDVAVSRVSGAGQEQPRGCGAWSASRPVACALSHGGDAAERVRSDRKREAEERCTMSPWGRPGIYPFGPLGK